MKMNQIKKQNENVCVKNRNKTKVKLFSVVSALLLCLMASFLTGCSSEKDGNTVVKDGKKQVRIGYFPNVNHAQGMIVKNQKLMEKELGDEYEISWVAFNAGPAEVEALFAGEIDMGYIGPVPAITANVNSNGDYKIIAGGANGGEALIGAKGVDSSSEGLKGKKIAVPQKGNTQHLSLLALLDKKELEVGTDDDKVEVVEAENADILNLLNQGAVEAALIPEPWISILLQDEEVQLLHNYDDIWQEGGNPTSAVIGNEDYLKENNKVYEAFMKAHKQATEYIENNKGEAIELVRQEMKDVTGKELDKEVLETAFQRMEFSVEPNQDKILAFAGLSKQEGFIKKEPQDLFYQK